MGFIARRLIKYNYDLVDVLVEDIQNKYFNVIELPTTFVQGRSAFKIFGSKFLKTGVPLKMEILDSRGNTVFVVPVDLVGEEVAPFLPYRFVTVEVYRPPINQEGLGRLTILGEIEPTAVDFEIPSQFQNTYNVKYSTSINIDLSTNINTQPIRFYKNPTIEAVEKVKARIVETPVTTTVKVFASSSAATRWDLKDAVIPVVTGSAVKPDGIPQAPKNKLAAAEVFFKEDFSYKTQRNFKFPPILARRGKRNIFASPEPEAFTISMADGGLKSSMQGATITIPEHTQIVENLDEDGNSSNKEVTVPEFTTKVLKVIDEKKFVPEDIPFIPDPDSNEKTSSINTGEIAVLPIQGHGLPVIIPDLQLVPISMSFEEYEETIISSSVHFDSFMELKVKNMRTFSGDVYRLKVHGAMKSKNDGFNILGDSIVESPELLIDKSSHSGFLRTGYFYTQSLVDTYWTGSSYEGNTRGDNISFLHTGSKYIDSLRLSGSNYGVNQTLVAEQKLGYEFQVDRSVPYTLIATIAGIRTDKETVSGTVNKEGKLYFHLTGSNLNTSKDLPTNADVGGELTDVDSNRVVVLKLNEDIEGFQKIGTIEFTFFPRLNLDRLSNTDTRLQIRADSGRWHISDLSLRPAMDSGFSPDEYQITVPLPRSTRPDKLNTFIEFFDINSNVAEEIAAAKDLDVLGSALVIDGDDNLLTGSLYMGNIAGAGIEMAGANSAYMRSVGYKGFISASELGHGGFMIFSGSVLPDEPDSYEGAGLEIHDGTTGDDESYFKFRTKPSIFDVKTKTFFLGSRSTGTGGGSSNFISGSQGNLEISSSGFVVTADGNVTASNFLFNSGVVSSDVSILGTVSANSILVPSMPGITVTAANASASISNLGNARFRSGSIGGFSIGTNAITATNFELNPSDKFISLGTGNSIFIVDADVGVQLGHATFGSAPFSVTKAGVLKAESGTVGGWTLSANDITSEGLLINSSGRIESANYASNQYGFRIDARNNGEAEFENVRIRGTLKTTVFEKETVNAVGGQLYVANSSTITGSNFFGTYVPSASATTTTMSIANVSGFTGSYGTTGTNAGEILAIKKVTSTGFSTEYVQVLSASRVDAGSDIDLRGHIYVKRAYNQGVAGDSGSLGDLASTAASYAEGQVIVSTGKIGTGFIRLNANPNDYTTPYIDIVERTGSGVYDTELKVRLGDMSGLSKTRLQGTDPTAAGFGLYSENVFLEGGIIANTGSIAGVKMQSNQLFLGTGTHGNSNTAFYVSGKSDATAGDFSLGDKLVWDNSEETLTIAGSITLTNPEDQGFTKTFRQTSAPTAITVGDLWYDTDDGNKLYRASATGASNWVATVDGTIATAQTQANTATTNAATAQTAIDLMETRVTIDNTGMALKAKSDGSSGTLNGQTIAEYGTTTTFFDGVASADTNRKLELNASGITLWGGAEAGNDYLNLAAGSLSMYSDNVRTLHITDHGINIGKSATGPSSDGATSAVINNISLHSAGVNIYGDHTSTYSQMSSAGLQVYKNGAGDSGLVATYGANTLITGGTVTLQGTTGTIGDDKLVLGSASIAMFAAAAKVLDIVDGKINIGPAAVGGTAVTGNVRVEGDNVYIYGDHTSTYTQMGSDGLRVYKNGAGDSGLVATYGANTIITGGTVTLQGTTGAVGHDKLVLGSASIAMYANQAKVLDIVDGKINIGPAAVGGTAVTGNVRVEGDAVYLYGDHTSTYSKMTGDGLQVYKNGAGDSGLVATYGANTLITGGSVTIQGTTGTIGDDKVTISSDGVILTEGGEDIITITGGEIEVSGSILEKTRIFGSGEDQTISLQDGGNSGTTNQESSYGVTGGNGSRIMLRGNGSNNDLHDAPNNGTADWHLEQDVYCRNLTLASPVILWTDGFRLFVKDTLTIASGATIANDGRPGVGTVGGEGGGGVAGATGTLSAGSSGTNGGEGGNAGSGGGQDAGDGGGGGGSGGFVFISARIIANSGVIRSHGGEGGDGQEPGA